MDFIDQDAHKVVHFGCEPGDLEPNLDRCDIEPFFPVNFLEEDVRFAPADLQFTKLVLRVMNC